ncbi:site-specific DNA-methyltransferase [Rhizobium laguerreae]|uniref:DNA-methyltransferase n=1 Tax=Rhizobium laguerreae TaxID=1076926 RepID=UPI001C921F0A|nr:DNA methyltransferase [Rhizobium laguerreae]MBY3263852.1 site-specific DNA-methyltransferase [Rhizobium laguerreae]
MSANAPEPRSFLDGRVTPYGGDNRDVLKLLPDNSIDSIVTDPPYALVSIVKRFGKPGSTPASGNDAYQRASAGFMGKQWDTGEVAFSEVFWAECLRVLKPGGHVVAFSGTRTYHRMTVAIEDAGFEIRDQLAWVYGSGFPKSHDVSKAIDKAAGAVREKVRVDASKLGNPPNMVGGAIKGDDRPWRQEAIERGYHEKDGDEPATPQAAEWQGWGTALKPAWEPIALARKPLAGTVAENVLEHGTGAINVDGCRVEGEAKPFGRGTEGVGGYRLHNRDVSEWEPSTAGRWPANIIHDGSDEVVAAFPAAPGQRRAVGPQHGAKDSVNVFGDYGPRDDFAPRLDSGSAARFFYSAKADKLDRLGSKHPTVKPVDLMQWLVRLVTPKGGVVLDPFAGSGSTGEAAWREGMRCILVEREEEYQADIAERLRLTNAGPVARKARTVKSIDSAGPLFGDNDNTPPPQSRTADLREVRGSTTGLSGQSDSGGEVAA